MLEDVNRQTLPPSLRMRRFPASNSSCLYTAQTRCGSEQWRAPFSTPPSGRTDISQTPVRTIQNPPASSALYFFRCDNGIVVGGEYTKETKDTHNVALTNRRRRNLDGACEPSQAAIVRPLPAKPPDVSRLARKAPTSP